MRLAVPLTARVNVQGLRLVTFPITLPHDCFWRGDLTPEDPQGRKTVGGGFWEREACPLH